MREQSVYRDGRRRKKGKKEEKEDRRSHELSTTSTALQFL